MQPSTSVKLKVAQLHFIRHALRMLHEYKKSFTHLNESSIARYPARLLDVRATDRKIFTFHQGSPQAIPLITPASQPAQVNL